MRWLSGLAVLVAAGYDAPGEWHQSFVPGRFASGGDVLLDLAGASAMVLSLRFATLRAGARADRPGGLPPLGDATERAELEADAEEARV